MNKEILNHLKVLRTKERKDVAKEIKKEMELYKKEFGKGMMLYDKDYDPLQRDIGIDFIAIKDNIIFISTVDMGYASIKGLARYETVIFLEGEKNKETKLPNLINELLKVSYTSREEAEEGHKKMVSILKDISNLK